MAEKKSKKVAAAAKNKPRYKAQMAITETNKRKTFARHLRNHPLDAIGVDLFEKKYPHNKKDIQHYTRRGLKRAGRAMAA